MVNEVRCGIFDWDSSAWGLGHRWTFGFFGNWLKVEIMGTLEKIFTDADNFWEGKGRCLRIALWYSGYWLMVLAVALGFGCCGFARMRGAGAGGARGLSSQFNFKEYVFYELREFLVVGRNCNEECFWILFFSRDKNEKRMFNVFC